MAKRTNTTTTGAAAKRRTPEMATQAAGTAHPFIDATPQFLWTYHPERWAVIAGKLVPSLQKVPLLAGVNRVEIDPAGRVRFAAARARLEEEGRTVIPYEWAPDGESYLQCLDTRPEGKKDVHEAWISVFEEATVGGANTSPDDEAYAEWLDGLVKAGKLPPCDVNTARRLLDKSTERLEKARADAAKLGGHGGASIRARALEIEAKVLEAYVTSGKAAKVAAKKKAAASLDGDDVPGGV